MVCPRPAPQVPQKVWSTRSSGAGGRGGALEARPVLEGPRQHLKQILERAEVLACNSALFGLDFEGAETARVAERMLRGEGSAGAAPVSRGPARISTPDREQRLLLFRALAARARAGSRIARVTAHWLRAGRALGLRPCHWEHARILAADEAGGPYLRVRAAPQKHGRRSGSAQRCFDLSGLKPAQRTAVLRLVEAVEEAGDKFGLLQGSCSQLLSRVCAELWSDPRRSVTLDSYRRGPD